MLTLSRKVGEKIMVGDNIEVTVIEIIHGKKVRLGIQAPADVVILREELVEKPREEKEGEGQSC